MNIISICVAFPFTNFKPLNYNILKSIFYELNVWVRYKMCHQCESYWTGKFFTRDSLDISIFLGETMDCGKCAAPAGAE